MQEIAEQNELTQHYRDAAEMLDDSLWYEYAIEANVLIFEKDNRLSTKDLRETRFPSTENVVSTMMYLTYDVLIEPLEDHHIPQFMERFGGTYSENMLIEGALMYLVKKYRLASQELFPQREVW